MLPIAGHLGLILAFVATLAAVWFYARAASLRPLDPASRALSLRTATWAWTVQTAGVTLASILLWVLLFSHRFDVAYVYQYTARALPPHYLFSAFWAGQEGSFLLWILLTAGLGHAILRWSPASWRAPVMAVVALCQMFLLSMIVGLTLGPAHLGSSPFLMLAEKFPDAPMLQTPGFVPADGNGLNDLLQNPWMAIHPPTLFTGFAILLAPFAFAVAALWQRRYLDWVRPALPWLTMGLLVLGVGIVLGGYWAYVTLSFGGYWAWDPVENSSLVPWIVGVAGLHAMLVQKKRAGAQRAALVLTILTFILVVYSTFLTRSGILGDTSVHSFVDLGLAGQLVVWIGAMTLGSLALIAVRWKELPRPEREAPTLSREFLTFTGALLLCALAAVIIVGTSAPILGRLFRDEPSAVPVAFYNAWSMPLMAAVMFFVSMGMLFWWNRMTVEQVNRALVRPLAAALGATALVVLLTPFAARSSAPATAAADAAPLVTAGMLDGFGAFWGEHGSGLMMLLLVFVAFFALFSNAGVAWRIGRGNWKMAGGAIAHVGLALVILGVVASSGFSTPLAVASGMSMPVVGGTSRDNFVLNRGETRTIGDYSVSYAAREKTTEGHDRYVLTFAKGARTFTLRPVAFQNKNGQWIQHPDVHTVAAGDVYAAVTPAEMFEVPDTAKKGGTVELARGASTVIGGDAFRLAFEGYETEVPAEALRGIGRDSIEVAVAARVQATNLETGEVQTLRPVYLVYKSGQQSFVQNRVPDWGLGLAFTGMNVDDGKVTLVVDGVPVTPDDWIVVQAYEKPLIGLVWFGVVLLTLGFLIAYVRRIREVAGRRTLATT